jgi:hypothetical protein
VNKYIPATCKSLQLPNVSSAFFSNSSSYKLEALSNLETTHSHHPRQNTQHTKVLCFELVLQRQRLLI